MKIEIRKANLNDLKEIRKLNQELFKYEYENFDNTLDCKWSLGKEHEKMFKSNIIKKDRITFVAVHNGKIIGYLSGSIHNEQAFKKLNKIAEVENTFILKKYRNKNIGRGMILRLFRWAKSKNMERARVVASYKNKKAINFYKKNRFLENEVILERGL